MRAVEVMIVIVDQAAGEEIDAEEPVLPANLGGIEGAGIVVPAEIAEQALVAVDEFLAADLQRERELLVIADEEIGLVNIQVAVVLGQGMPGLGGIRGDVLIAAFIAVRGAG